MKHALLVVAVTILILFLSAALTVLVGPVEHAFQWMLVLWCALSSMVALPVMVVLLLKDLTQTTSNYPRRRRPSRSHGVSPRAQATPVGNRDSEKISPLGRHCLRRDRGFERNAMDNRVAATYETQQKPPPTQTYVPGRKPMSDWHRARTRDDRQGGFSNLNQRRH